LTTSLLFRAHRLLLHGALASLSMSRIYGAGFYIATNSGENII
jgi:hypothetical protein